jgi:D-alanyl-D-alanine carboxypeptidase (penicillin-binding protein 5/6)
MRRVRVWSLCLFACLALAAARPAAAQPFQTAAVQAILVDAGSGTVMFEKAADEPMAPASMAKIMTAEILFGQIKAGKLTLESEFPISENAWRRGGGPSGGSSMFAQVGSRIKLADLLRGIIVQSGNDASIAAAEGVAGSEDNFARMMTVRARELGLTGSTFRNATGYGHPEQKVTARDLAKLTIHVVETYPDLYKMFSEEEFTWNKIRQRNRNPLLAMGIGADGVKTGNIDESGFGLVGSAVQNEQRLIVVVNGLRNSRDRANEARKLLDWGFRAFEPRQLFALGEPVGGVQVFGGTTRSLPVVAKKPISVLVPRGTNERISARIFYKGPLQAPVRQGAPVAQLRIARGDVQALDIPLYAAEDVAVGSLPQRALDGALELGVGLFRRGFAAAKGS